MNVSGIVLMVLLFIIVILIWAEEW